MTLTLRRPTRFLAPLCLLPLTLALPAHAAPRAQVARREAQAILRGQRAILSTLRAALPRQAPARSIQVAQTGVFGEAFTNTTGKLFMLHWQMSDIAYGTVPYRVIGSVDGYVQAITEAKACGADGFGLNLGGNSPDYLASVANMYAAVNQVNAAAGWVGGQTGTTNAQGVGRFSVYIKFDFSNPSLENTQTVVSMLRPLLSNPANFTWQGRPVYSNYVGGGNRSWASLAAIFGPANAALTAGGVKPFVIWGGEPTGPDGHYVKHSLQSLTAWAKGCVRPIADAVWQFPSGATPVGTRSNILGLKTLAEAVHAAGLQFQSSLNPSYGQPANPHERFIEQFCGGEGIHAEWRSILGVQKPELGVEFATANDLDEESNLLSGGSFMAGGLTPDPTRSVWVGYRHARVPGYYQSKLGLQTDNLFYVQGMKTGRPPRLTRDTLCVYYQTQIGTALESPTADPLGPIYSEDTEVGSSNPNSTPDTIYVTCDTAHPGRVRLTQDGGYTVIRIASGGQSFVRLPCHAGPVKIDYLRNGQILFSMNGVPISATAAVADPNDFTMTAHD